MPATTATRRSTSSVSCRASRSPAAQPSPTSTASCVHRVMPSSTSSPPTTTQHPPRSSTQKPSRACTARSVASTACLLSTRATTCVPATGRRPSTSPTSSSSSPRRARTRRHQPPGSPTACASVGSGKSSRTP
ncbi:hypothetical protein ACFPRL_25750 [Pseudoclavibacter helvolus]